MIVFSGKITNEIQTKIMKLRNTQIMILGLIIAAIIFPCLVAVCILTESENELLKYSILLLLMIIVFIGVGIPISKKKLCFEWDFYIRFENAVITIEFMHQNGAVQRKCVSNVKKVIDFGEYFYLYFSRWDASNGLVCQKDLIIEGTIEDFEKLFEGKIKRKLKS